MRRVTKRKMRSDQTGAARAYAFFWPVIKSKTLQAMPVAS